ncbi:hypothetical protein D3C84_603290 [compost metagenome]
MFQTEEVLLVDIFQSGMPGTHGGAVTVERVIAAHVVEGITRHLPLRLVAQQRLEFALAGFIAQGRRGQMPGLQRQAGDFAAGNARALIGRWQQTDVAEDQCRQVGLQFTDFQLGFGNAHLRRQPETTIIVSGMAIVLDR